MSAFETLVEPGRPAEVPLDTTVVSAGIPAGHGRIADIELLRGFAVLFTILEHARDNLISWHSPLVDGFYSYFRFGCGVDLFFAISGFVIARGLVPSLDGCRDSLDFVRVTLAFWVRRAWRLLPSAWLWLALVLALSLAFNRSGLFGSFRTNVEATIAGLLDVANFRFMAAFGHFPYGASFSYWSLSLEEQFYLVFPAVIFLSRRWLPLVLGAGVLLQLFVVRTPFLMVVRTDALMLGILIALWSRGPTYRLFEPRGLARNRLARGAVLTLPLVLLAAVEAAGSAVVWFPIGLIALLSAALVLVASFDGDYLMRDGRVKRALLWVGGRSYALYLLHVPVMFAVRELWLRLAIEPAHGRGWLLVLLALALMAVLAELNFRLVEAPLRARGARIAGAILVRGRA
ncbi:acyltransferase [Aliidongia dinghuensis]|uniref:Acyltransferase n=1 Tax=Aliidongia dinghuensis TaxID=1867774 RepID=A0A8J3E2W7_9PROT|nr:acyltransferase [Aliidongia dinghuensis]GGF01980.1 acyltransferase [Aliidongia dinghuensis]